MTKTSTLNAQLRKKDENLYNLRKAGVIPAVIYGSRSESKSIQFKKTEFDKIYEAAGESTLINVVIDGGEPQKVIIKDAQRDIKKHDFTHVDLFLIDMQSRIKAVVPLVFIGESKAEKQGGLLLKTLNEIEIECLPGDLVNHVEINLGELEKFGDHILVRDLNLGENIKIMNDDSSLIVNVTELKKVVEKSSEDEPSATESEDVKEEETKIEEGKTEEKK